jgi:hypothetical protein
VERYFSTKKASDNGRFIVISYDDTSRRIWVYYSFPRAEFCWGLAHSYRKMRYLRHHFWAYVGSTNTRLQKTA